MSFTISWELFSWRPPVWWRIITNDHIPVNVSFCLYFQIDTLVPSYSCPKANQIRSNYQASSVPAWQDHIVANQDLQNRLDRILGTSGLSAWSSWCGYPSPLVQVTLHNPPELCIWCSQMTISSTRSPVERAMDILSRVILLLVNASHHRMRIESTQ
jgi:hypothetical protein